MKQNKKNQIKDLLKLRDRYTLPHGYSRYYLSTFGEMTIEECGMFVNVGKIKNTKTWNKTNISREIVSGYYTNYRFNYRPSNVFYPVYFKNDAFVAQKRRVTAALCLFWCLQKQKLFPKDICFIIMYYVLVSENNVWLFEYIEYTLDENLTEDDIIRELNK